MREATLRADRSTDRASAGWVATIPRSAPPSSEPSIQIQGDHDSPAVATVHNLSVMFDGALYNGAELTNELGISTAATGAEIVLAAWQRWGIAALERLKGIFLLAVADRGAGSIAVARDPLGVYPGFYVLGGDALHVST